VDHRLPRKFKHIFLDAEGTLYVPSAGKSYWSFWENPSPERALEHFELDKGVAEAIGEIRAEAETLCIASFNREAILDALLDRFGIRGLFDSILLNGDKGVLIDRFLKSRGLERRDAVMVGDMPGLDLSPVRKVGVESILVDRPYNKWAEAERIKGIFELPSWLRIAAIAESELHRSGRVSSLDEFINGRFSDGRCESDSVMTKSLMAFAEASGAAPTNPGRFSYD